MNANMARLAFNYPSGTRVRITASVLLPSTSDNLASVWSTHHDVNQPRGEMDLIESYGPNYTGGAKAQVATHACWTGLHGEDGVDTTCAEATSATHWNQRVDNLATFPWGSKPWDTWHTYTLEFTVASTYNVNFSSRDGGGNLMYSYPLPSGKVSRVGAGRDYFMRVTNKYTPNTSGATRTEMWVDWIKLEILV